MRWHRIPEDPEELLALGVKLHGHLGPFMVAGLRMGRLALRLLSHPGYHGIRAEVDAGTTPPVSCLIDGIQVSTGCTPGKGNLAVREGGRPRARFRAGGREVGIELRDAWIEEFRRTDAPEELALRVLRLPDEELFAWRVSP